MAQLLPMKNSTGNFKRMFAKLLFIAGLVVLIMVSTSRAFAGAPDSLKCLSLAGYLKELPYAQFVMNTKTQVDNIVNLRLNLNAQLTKHTNVVAEFRNRYMAGNYPWGDSLVVASFKDNNGWINAATAFAVGRHGLVHLMADRFYIEQVAGNWQWRLGRQRINWGINTVSNPNDLFNTYSFFDFDYPERPGSDAVRVQYNMSGMSHAEFAIAPANHISRVVAAFLYATNIQGYDLQFIGGVYHNRLVAGGGWASHLGGAGFKGEISLFSNLSGSQRKTDFVGAISGDFMFGNGLYLMAEAIYNGGYTAGSYTIGDIYKPLSADNIIFSRYAVTASLSYPVSPILNASLSGMILPDIKAYFISPAITCSAMKNLDISLSSQYFAGESVINSNTGILVLIGSLQYSF